MFEILLPSEHSQESWDWER